MTELTVAAMRLGFFILLWLFVFIVAAVLRRDLFAPRAKKAAKQAKKSDKQADRAAKKAARSENQQAVPANAYAPVAPQPSAPEQSGTGRELVITSGHLVGVSVALGNASVTLGRANDNTVVLDDDFASGHHARIYPEGFGWILEDLGSTNGTFLADHRVTGAVQLPVNVPVTVGHTTLELRT